MLSTITYPLRYILDQFVDIHWIPLSCMQIGRRRRPAGRRNDLEIQSISLDDMNDGRKIDGRRPSEIPLTMTSDMNEKEVETPRRKSHLPYQRVSSESTASVENVATSPRRKGNIVQIMYTDEARRQSAKPENLEVLYSLPKAREDFVPSTTNENCFLCRRMYGVKKTHKHNEQKCSICRRARGVPTLNMHRKHDAKHNCQICRPRHGVHSAHAYEKRECYLCRKTYGRELLQIHNMSKWHFC